MSDSKIDTNEYVSQVLMVQAKDGTALGTIGEQDGSVGFSTSRVCETLCADEQFIGELVGIARSEIPGILDQIDTDLKDLIDALNTAVEYGDRYLRSIHGLRENTEPLLLDGMNKLLPEARCVVIPVVTTRDHATRIRRTLIDRLTKEFQRFEIEATEAGFAPPKRKVTVDKNEITFFIGL